MQDASGFGWRELRALWEAKGGDKAELRRAVKAPYRFQRDSGDYLYVAKEGETSEVLIDHEPPPVEVLRETLVETGEPPEPKMPAKGDDGIHHHGPFCDCEWCDEPIKPKYATSFARSGA
jgi:hypothetical protein